METRIGPEITIRKSCSGCKYCLTEHYHVQGDTGFDKHCTHPTFDEHRDIGLSWNTPKWCPEDQSQIPEVTEGEIDEALLDFGHNDFEGYISQAKSGDIAKAIKSLYKNKLK